MSMIRWYGQYIDDLLLVWQCTEDELSSFVAYCNNNPFNLSFKDCSAASAIDFLDLTLIGDTESRVIHTQTYRKETAGNSILRATSCHPHHVFRLVPVGEMVRARRNCSTQESLSFFDNITSRLAERGYSIPHLEKARSTAVARDRDTLLQPKKKGQQNKQLPGTIFSTPYSKEYHKIKQIVDKNITLLKGDQKMALGYHCVSRKAPTLATYLSPSLFCSPRSNHTWLSTKGFFKCGETRCEMCKWVNNTKEIRSSNTNKVFQIQGIMNCNSMVEWWNGGVPSDVYELQYTLCRLHH